LTSENSEVSQQRKNLIGVILEVSTQQKSIFRRSYYINTELL